MICEDFYRVIIVNGLVSWLGVKCVHRIELQIRLFLPAYCKFTGATASGFRRFGIGGFRVVDF
jgi:hypothetical protein